MLEKFLTIYLLLLTLRQSAYFYFNPEGIDLRDLELLFGIIQEEILDTIEEFLLVQGWIVVG